MKHLYILAASLLLFAGKGSAQTITTPVFAKSSYVKYEKAEATFKLSSTYSNPYDSAVIQVDAQITLPTGPTIVVPCFYYVPTTLNGGTATLKTAGATWMLRYAPTVTGIHTVKIRAIPAGNSANAYTSSSTTFTVTAGSLPGFVRVDANNKQFYRLDNGTPYYPVGIDIAWNSDNTLAQYYHNYLNKIGRNGITWMRYWLTDFAGQALEWSSGHWTGFYNGLGAYAQQPSAMLDSVVNDCSKRGIYLQLTMQHHGQFSTTVNAEWTGNAYNIVNGGFLTSPCDFFTNAQAIGQAKKQYRYIVARWGYSTNIFAWELFNEVNFTTDASGNACTQTSIASWHSTMSNYLKSRDVNQKLVTTSCGNPGNPILAAMDGANTKLDILQFHDYPSSPVENPMLSDDISALSYAKSTLCGEFGLSSNYDNTAPVWADNAGDHVRKTVWIGQMNKVPNMFWYWNGYIDSKNLYTILTPLNTYLQGSDIVKETGAATTNFTFTANPAIIGTVTATPSKSFSGWPCTNSPNPWTATVGADGSVPGLNTLCPYLMGSWSGVTQDVSFTVTFQTAGTAVANLAGSSTSGTNSLQIFIDGTLSNTFSVANGASGALSVNVPAGKHVVRFYNNGQDWLQINNFSFTNVQLLKCVAYGYAGKQNAYGYVYDKSYGAWADLSSVTAITKAVIKIGALNPGNYQVDFFDPQAGTAFISGGTYTSTNPSDSITVVLPSFKKDIAFKVYPSTTVTGVSDQTMTTASAMFYASPNPFKSSTLINLNLPSATQVKVVVYDQTGRQVAILTDKFLDAGLNSLEFDRKGLPSGIYFCQISSLNNQATLKIIAE